jgi:hypothetical protein
MLPEILYQAETGTLGFHFPTSRADAGDPVKGGKLDADQ